MWRITPSLGSISLPWFTISQLPIPLVSPSLLTFPPLGCPTPPVFSTPVFEWTVVLPPLLLQLLRVIVLPVLPILPRTPRVPIYRLPRPVPLVFWIIHAIPFSAFNRRRMRRFSYVPVQIIYNQQWVLEKEHVTFLDLSRFGPSPVLLGHPKARDGLLYRRDNRERLKTDAPLCQSRCIFRPFLCNDDHHAACGCKGCRVSFRSHAFDQKGPQNLCRAHSFCLVCHKCDHIKDHL